MSCEYCNCIDEAPCRCVTSRANDLRSDVEHKIRRLLRKEDLGVVNTDGLIENNIGLLEQLMRLHTHFRETQGAVSIHAAAKPRLMPHEQLKDDCCHQDITSCHECSSEPRWC